MNFFTTKNSKLWYFVLFRHQGFNLDLSTLRFFHQCEEVYRKRQNDELFVDLLRLKGKFLLDKGVIEHEYARFVKKLLDRIDVLSLSLEDIIVSNCMNN